MKKDKNELKRDKDTVEDIEQTIEYMEDYAKEQAELDALIEEIEVRDIVNDIKRGKGVAY